MLPRTAIGIDVGGTKIRVARVTPSGEVLAHRSAAVEASRDGFCAQLVGMARELADATSRGIGVGIPGRVDRVQGTVLSAGFLDVAGLDVRRTLADALGLPTRVENDATMALIGEASRRPAGATGTIAMVTVGTGIGGAILDHGRPWYGGGLSGQFGHLVVASDGEPCLCGRRGCVETLSSGTALSRLLARHSFADDLSVATLFDGAATGDAAAKDVLNAWAAPMQRALQTLVAAIDPKVIIVGGGLGGAMVRALSESSPEGGWFPLPVEPAQLGDAAGVIGAGLSCFDEAAT